MKDFNQSNKVNNNSFYQDDFGERISHFDESYNESELGDEDADENIIASPSVPYDSDTYSNHFNHYLSRGKSQNNS